MDARVQDLKSSESILELGHPMIDRHALSGRKMDGVLFASGRRCVHALEVRAGFSRLKVVR
jgi:hypothetical protein